MGGFGEENALYVYMKWSKNNLHKIKLKIKKNLHHFNFISHCIYDSYMQVDIPQHACRGQRATPSNWVSPPLFTCFPGTELRSAACMASIFPLLSRLTSSLCDVA